MPSCTFFLSREPCCFTPFCVQKKANKALAEQEQDEVRAEEQQQEEQQQEEESEKVRYVTVILFV